MKDYDLYKLKQLKAMLVLEKDQDVGGYGAHLSHWAGAKPINLDAGGLQALIDYYENLDRPTKKVKLTTSDLQRTVIATIGESSHVSVYDKDPEKEAAYNKLTDIYADWNHLVSEANDWTVEVTVRG
jgi:hypothetical protein